MKNILKVIIALLGIVTATACKDKESYADLLNDENQAVNDYLANYPVIGAIPADSVFETTADIMSRYPGMSREDAIKLTPFYRMDDDGYVYMQVVNPGTAGNRAKYDQVIYFRFTRWNLGLVYKYGDWSSNGNASDLGTNTTSFRFGNTTLQSTTQWGEGIQVPLRYLNLDCEVNMVIKSYLGPTEEISSVYPYLYSVRYFPSKI